MNQGDTCFDYSQMNAPKNQFVWLGNKIFASKLDAYNK